MSGFPNFLKVVLWPRVEEPLVLILVHLISAVSWILSVMCVDLVLRISRLDGRVIPGTEPLTQWLGSSGGVTLSDWMLPLEVFGGTIIIIVGIFRGLRRS
jgi:hypothetical protein